MNSSIKPNRKSRALPLLSALLIGAVFAFGGTATLRADPGPKVYAPNSTKHGNDYAGWSAAAMKWSMELPLDGHPAIDDPGFDVSTGQTGDVWFLACSFGAIERTCTIPSNKAHFITLLNVECSSLEGPDMGFHGDTAKEQRECAKDWADHIINVFCEVDGVVLKKINSYRVTSPQFSFTAPTPWLFGDIGGTGTSVGDGYYVFVAPLPPGQHTIHYGGEFHFTLAEDGFDADLPVNRTYVLTVQ